MLTKAFWYWLKLGFISFGGPAGQIAIMHQDLVEKKRWISERRFLHALNYCMVLPGPEAQQLAVYIGWLMHKTWGGIIAGTLFVLPSLFILIFLSWITVRGDYQTGSPADIGWMLPFWFAAWAAATSPASPAESRVSPPRPLRQASPVLLFVLILRCSS